MGQELLRRSGSEPTSLWSAQVMMDQPDIVRDLHVDYITAGARVLTLNAYSATPERLDAYGAGEHFEALQAAAIKAALEARDVAAVDGVKIAGCLPPLVTSYRPDLTPDPEVSLEIYKRICALQADHVDFFLCETMASTAEARAAAMAAKETGRPVWVSLTVDDDDIPTLRSGELLVDALAMLDSVGVAAKLLNCSKPEAIAASWSVLSSSQGHVGGYANGFTSIMKLEPGSTVKAFTARHDLTPEQHAKFALGWVAEGASIVGGCCEVGPQHIAHLAQQLDDNRYSITGELI